MRKILLLIVFATLVLYILKPQWRSLERMGERRFQRLNTLPEEILVGVFWPFTLNGDGMADGLQLALDEINTGGLAGGVPIRLEMREDTLDWEQGKRIALEFADTPGMSAVLGHYDDSEAVKASMMYESSRLLHIIAGANSTPMTRRGLNYIVRTILSSEKIAQALAQLSFDRNHRKIALIWEEDAYGEDLAYQYHVALDARDEVEVVYEWSYPRERADFRMAVNQLKSVNADMIFFAGLEPWAGDFLKAARGVGIKTEIIGAFSDTPEMRARAGEGLEGSIFFDEYNVNSTSPENQAFVRKFKARFHKDPDTWAVQGYDSLHILAKAIKMTRSANPLDLSYAIRFMEAWTGANGKYKFDNTGELEDKPLFLNSYKGGKPVTIQESHRPAQPEVAPSRP
jgi:branched-chain amino acid transport system substrate-binding protein